MTGIVFESILRRFIILFCWRAKQFELRQKYESNSETSDAKTILYSLSMRMRVVCKFFVFQLKPIPAASLQFSAQLKMVKWQIANIVAQRRLALRNVPNNGIEDWLWIWNGKMSRHIIVYLLIFDLSSQVVSNRLVAMRESRDLNRVECLSCVCSTYDTHSACTLARFKNTFFVFHYSYLIKVCYFSTNRLRVELGSNQPETLCRELCSPMAYCNEIQ